MKPNDELLLNYGCLSNDLFLLDYGFVVPSNPYDCIELKYDGAFLDAASMAAGVSSPNFSSPSPWKKQILSQLNLDGPAPSLKVPFTIFLGFFLSLVSIFYLYMTIATKLFNTTFYYYYYY